MQKSIAMLIVLAGFALGWSLALAQEAGAHSAHGLTSDAAPDVRDASCPESHGALPHAAAMADTSAHDAAPNDGTAPGAPAVRDAATQDAPATAKSKAPATSAGAGSRGSGAALRWQSLLPGVMK